METANNIYEIASDFAIRIVKLYKYLTEQKKRIISQTKNISHYMTIGTECMQY